MSEDVPSKLYTTDILALAVDLAAFPYDPTSENRADIRSRSCGSTLAISIQQSEAGAVMKLGLRVQACAVGQASAAIFARDATGRTLEDLEREVAVLKVWLSGEVKAPHWAGIELLRPARTYPGRHEAILMPWRAAILALSNAQTPS